MADTEYEDFLRNRITALRLQKNVSEHKMSLDLDKSGSYIRGITNGTALPSVRELFRIIEYFDITPSEFFQPLNNGENPYENICTRIQRLSDSDLEKISIILDWFGV